MSSRAVGTIAGPPSIGCPEPSNVRPSISSETSRRATSPLNRTRASSIAMPRVPTKTWTTAWSWSTSSTLAAAGALVRGEELDQFVVSDALDALDGNQRPRDGRHGPVFFDEEWMVGCRVLHFVQDLSQFDESFFQSLDQGRYLSSRFGHLPFLHPAQLGDGRYRHSLVQRDSTAHGFGK